MKCFVAFLFIFLISLAANAADVNLAWDASVSANVTNYRIYYGTASRTYSNHDHLGNVLTHIVTGLGVGTWYFTATALDINNNESEYSNEVSTTIGTPTISCDVNADGSINVLDLQTMTNMILGKISMNLLFDFNQDGSLNVLDLQILTNVILGKITCP